MVALLNRRATLERCLDSVIGQSYGARELVVIDGGSTDGSLELLRSRGAAIAHWESAPDRGLYHAFNKALGKSTGEWIYFLGADDYLWDRQALEKIAPHLAHAAPQHRVVYAQANFVTTAGEVLETMGAPWEGHRRRFLQGFMIPHQATFHHRSLFEERGGFDEGFRMGGDYEPASSSPATSSAARAARRRTRSRCCAWCAARSAPTASAIPGCCGTRRWRAR